MKSIAAILLSIFSFKAIAQPKTTQAKLDTNSRQVKTTIYKSDHWADTKGKGSFAKAMENPTEEDGTYFITVNYRIDCGVQTHRTELELIFLCCNYRKIEK